MGSGYSPVQTYTIAPSDVAEICGDAYTEFITFLTDRGYTFEGYCKAVEWGDKEMDDEEFPEELWDELNRMWTHLSSRFTNMTKVGKSRLTLLTGFHDSEGVGSRYDDVDGGFFEVAGVLQLTSAAVKLGSKLKATNYVQHG